MKTFTIKILGFIVLLYVVTVGLSWLMDFCFQEDFMETKSHWILRQKNKHYDFAAVGSSRVYNMVDIGKMEMTSGGTGINLGTSGSGYPENYLILEKFTRTNTIDHVVLNVDPWSLNSEKSFSYSFHDFEFLPFFHDDSVNRVFKDVEGYKYYLWSILPISKYIEFNNRFSFLSLRKKKFPFYEFLDGTKGYRPRREEGATTVHNGKAQRRNTVVEISALDTEYFFRILSLCKSRNIRVVLITTPIQLATAEGSPADQFIREAAIKYGVKYFHFSEIGDFSDPGYFDDPTHTSVKGTLYYSQRLAEVLKAAREI